MAKGSMGGRGSGTVSNAAYRDLRNARNAGRPEFPVYGFNKDGSVRKEPSFIARSQEEAEAKAKYMESVNPGKKFTTTPKPESKGFVGGYAKANPGVVSKSKDLESFIDSEGNQRLRDRVTKVPEKALGGSTLARVAASNKRDKLANQIQKGLAGEHFRPLPADPFQGFRDAVPDTTHLKKENAIPATPPKPNAAVDLDDDRAMGSMVGQHEAAQERRAYEAEMRREAEQERREAERNEPNADMKAADTATLVRAAEVFEARVASQSAGRPGTMASTAHLENTRHLAKLHTELGRRGVDRKRVPKGNPDGGQYTT